MRFRGVAWLTGCLLMGMPFAAAGQAIAEHAAAAAASAAAGAGGGKTAGKTAGAVWDKLGKTLEKAVAPEKAGPRTQVVPKRPAEVAVKVVPSSSAPPAEPSVRPVNADEITTGMSDEDLRRKCGTPSLRITTGPGGETLWYTSTAGDPVTVTIRDRKVASVSVGSAKRAPVAQ